MSEAPYPRILIVDDELAQMKALCATLREHNYQTTGFPAPKSALAALRPGQFDLLLTDLMMPGMDGIALLQVARQIDPRLVGVMMTGAGTVATAVEAMKAGALDYILKPFELSVILPVIERALAMRRLRIINAELDEGLRQRTSELEAANKELEAFSYSVSHDLRAPLRAMDGFSSILMADFRPDLPAEARRLLQNISINARRMGQLIDDLLGFSRLSRQPLTRQQVDVAAIVHGVLRDLFKEADRSRLEVSVAELPDCEGDASLLTQVFVNLLSNAVKFSRHREKARIEVGCHQHGQEQVYFVRDNGAGFDMQYAEKLFGVFQRFHRSDEFEGTGVGLSIVQRIIHRHGGRIWAEAHVNKGATFYFTIPQATELVIPSPASF
jgi:signal transduction histidine kinase